MFNKFYANCNFIGKKWTSKKLPPAQGAFLQMPFTQQPLEVTAAQKQWRYVSPPWCCNPPLECSTAPSGCGGTTALNTADPPQSSSTSVNCFEKNSNNSVWRFRCYYQIVDSVFTHRIHLIIIKMQNDAIESFEYTACFYRSCGRGN